MGDAARTLTEADAELIEGIISKILDRRLGDGSPSPRDEEEPRVRVTAADIERIAERRRKRGPVKRRRR